MYWPLIYSVLMHVMHHIEPYFTVYSDGMSLNSVTSWAHALTSIAMSAPVRWEMPLERARSHWR